MDDRGRVLLHSGEAADGGSGPVDPGAHFYRSLQLDEHGNPINKRNAWATRSVAYVRLIPPGAADTVHYRLEVPEDAGDRITLRAKVNYRKFAWWFTQWAYAGVRDPADPAPSVTSAHDDGRWVFTGDTSDVSGKVKAIPDIPTTVMAEATATLAVIDADAPLPAAPAVPPGDARQRGRWNDYGIGLLLQGDLRGAEAAFRRVMAIDPEYPDGPVNAARARLQEGDVDAAIPLLEQALALEPDLARAPLLPRHRPAGARPLRGGAGAPGGGARAVSARPAWSSARSDACSSSTGGSRRPSPPTRRFSASIPRTWRRTTI